jgi:hypothetical protein
VTSAGAAYAGRTCPSVGAMGALPGWLTLYAACTPRRALTTHAAWDVDGDPREARSERSERSEQSDPGSRAAVLDERGSGHLLGLRANEEGSGYPGAIRSERSEQSDPGSRAAVLDERGSGHVLGLRASEEGSGYPGAIRSERSEQSDTVG